MVKKKKKIQLPLYQMMLWGFVCDLWSKEKVLPPNMQPFFLSAYLKWGWVSLTEVNTITYIKSYLES